LNQYLQIILLVVAIYIAAMVYVYGPNPVRGVFDLRNGNLVLMLRDLTYGNPIFWFCVAVLFAAFEIWWLIVLPIAFIVRLWKQRDPDVFNAND
jgi:hypothetical protein